jgi:hypothetical protein
MTRHGIDEASLDLLANRAKMEDDRKNYKDKVKYGKTYKQFVSKSKDDRSEYKNKMKYGKHGKGE